MNNIDVKNVEGQEPIVKDDSITIINEPKSIEV